MEGRSRLVWLYALLAFALPMTVYWLTLCPTVFSHAESAEYVTAAVQGGVPHPPGSPTYMLLARTVLRFAPGEAARKLNALSAVFGALAIWGVFLCLRELVQRDLPALLGALSLGAVASFWRLAVITEIHTLHLFLLSMQILFLLRYRRSKGRAHAAFFALFFAFGLGNHPSTLFVLVALVFFFLAERHCPEAGSFLLAVLIVSVVTGGLYLSLPFAQANGSHANPWTELFGRDISSPSGFLWYVTGKPLWPNLFARSAGKLWPHVGQITWSVAKDFDTVGLLLRKVAPEATAYTPALVLALVLLGAFFHFRGQAGSFFLVASLMASYLVFYGGLNELPEGLTYALPLHLLFIAWAVVAFKGLLLMAERRPSGGRVLVVLLYLLALGDVALLARNGWTEGGAAERREGRTFVEEAAKRLPPGSVLLADATSYWLLRYGALTDSRLEKVELFPFALATRAMWQNFETESPAERLLAIRDKWHRIVDIKVNTREARVFTTMPNLASLQAFPKTPVGAGLHRLEKTAVPILRSSLPEGGIPLDGPATERCALAWLRAEEDEVPLGGELRLRLGWKRLDDDPLGDTVVTLLVTPAGRNEPLRPARFGHPFVFHRLGHGHAYLGSWRRGEVLEERLELHVPPKDSPLNWGPGNYDLWISLSPLPGTHGEKARTRKVWTFSVREPVAQ